MIEFITNKPVLIGMHLGAGIVGIDAFLWVMGELIAKSKHKERIKNISVIGLASFVISWLAGGYYYVKYYGGLVKPIIKEGLAPWAHGIAMETKEHVFLFIIPLAATITFLVLLKDEDTIDNKLRRKTIILAGMTAVLGLAIGAMGFIVSAAARWGAV